ncbi:MAG: terminase family protein [Candidatus Lernaella stagnicola]|nr:terminase family protein [Candidatus Lernaella stagnicola]
MILAPRRDPFYIPGPSDWYRPEFDAANPPILDPWQVDWVSDKSRFKMALKCRQSGYSFAETYDQVAECAETPGTVWIDLSRGQRQSDELIEKCAMHVEAFDAAIEQFDGRPFEEEEVYCESIAAKVTIRTIRFRNGSKIIGLPANADTARGLSGNVFLDEFAIHRHAREIKAALVPVITRGYKIRAVFTPYGKGGPAYEMWSDRGSGYSKHRVDIYEVAARGIHLQPDIEALRDAMADDEMFSQEFECVFLDEGTAFIPHELLNHAESDQATTDTPLADISADSFAGVDVGRRHDQTVIWVVEKTGDGRLATRQITVLKNTPFAEQEIICGETARRVGRMAIDETGLGMMLAENLQRKFGAKIIPVTFTVAEKEDLAVRLKRSLEDRAFMLPADRMVRASFHSIKRMPGTGGHFRFDAGRTDETGHADAFWAAALASRAALLPAIKIAYTTVATRPLGGFFRGRTKETNEVDAAAQTPPGPRKRGGGRLAGLWAR